MTLLTNTYYKSVFWAPIVIPSLVFVISLLMGDPGFQNTGGSLANQAAFLIFSLQVAGIPYLLFLVASHFLLKKDFIKGLKQYSFIAPLIFIPILMIGYWITTYLYALLVGDSSWIIPFSDIIATMGLFSIYVMVVGYTYVLLAFLGYHLLKLAGLVIDDET
ncbi:MAG: hypothetical protein U5J95_09525 [Balneolaceae bacterium]|nr:hypothetical protein [Balneolaceae bacterium]